MHTHVTNNSWDINSYDNNSYDNNIYDIKHGMKPILLSWGLPGCQVPAPAAYTPDSVSQ